MIKSKTVAHVTIALAAALCGFVSSVSAITTKQLDTNPATPAPSQINNVQDNVGSDFVRANMFVGNWFGLQGALTDATATFSGAPPFKVATLVVCSDNSVVGGNTLSFNNLLPNNGIEGQAFCAWPTSAVGSFQTIRAN